MTENYNYSIVANHIVSKYIDRISGVDIEETFVDNGPDKRVMVGNLAKGEKETDGSTGGYVENNNTQFKSVPSISVSFAVKKDPLGIINIIPRGLLFYTVQPDYKKTVDYIIKLYSKKKDQKFESIEQLCDCFPEETFKPPLTYKRVRIEDEIDSGISIRLDSIKAGPFHLEDEINKKLQLLAEKISDEIRIVRSDCKITLFDLKDEKSFRKKTNIKDQRVMPGWKIDIYCNVIEEDDNFRFLLQLVNKTEETTNLGYLPQLYNAGMKITGNENVKFLDIKLDYFKNSYKNRAPVYAVTENTSAFFNEEENAIYTDNIPKYYQKRLKTKDDYNQYVTFENLISDPVGNLSSIYEAMLKDYDKCVREYNSVAFCTETAKQKFKEDLDEYNREISRFKKGIEQIEYKDFVKKAFIYMNKTFSLDWGEQRKIQGWRLFQIVFIVSLICEMIRSEYKNDNTIAEADFDVANLLYFPTGGGKTEAFLGACVFDMFFDRLRGKNYGITAFLKYPLRLLAVQQLDRVLTVVIKADYVRKNIPELKDTRPFEVGFFVGKNNTPNKIDSKEMLSNRGSKRESGALILESVQDTLNDYYRFIDTCPRCGQKNVNVRFNKESWKLEHNCDNPKCEMTTLPLLIVDDEIYRYLPSIVVSIIDKMAMLGTSSKFKMLFGQVVTRCPTHGFSLASPGSKCLCEDCKNKSLEPVEPLKDPIPTLFIQDEMHLVKESLGTFDAHYESFINYYAKELVPEKQRKQIRFVGATATISMYKEHIKNLYHMNGRRFPCEYPSIKSGEDFYSYTDDKDITRIILGYAPYGRSITDGMWESVYTARVVVYRMLFDDTESNYKAVCKKGFVGTIDDFREMLYDYWIELVYNNRKQDAMELENSFQNQANNLLKSESITEFKIEQMTSDVDFQTVRKTLFDIQSNRTKLESTNLILATSTISHGVDEDSFNIMYFFGMPNNNAEYIQAYSRTGRKYTGIVIDIIRLMRVRDRSYLKNFVIFHQNKDDLVESVPINRWAKNAVYSSLPGLLSGILMQYYYALLETNKYSIYKAVTVKKLLTEEKIKIEEVAKYLVEAYGCSDQEKMSMAYKETIEKEVMNILSGIKNGNFLTDDTISKAIAMFSHGKKAPMESLRDTEEQIEIKI